MNLDSTPVERDALHDRTTAEAPPGKPCVLVIEPHFGGHRWRYVEWIVEALHDTGYTCVVATDVANRRHPLIDRLTRATPPISIFWHARETQPGLPGTRSTAAATFRRLTRANSIAAHFSFLSTFADIHRAVTSRIAVDMVVVPYCDYIIDAIGILGSPFDRTPWLGVLMRRAFHLREMGVLAPRRRLVDAIKRRLFVRALRYGNPAALLTIDPTLAAWRTRTRVLPSAPPLRYLPDPSPDVRPIPQSAARAQIGTPAEKTILVYGAVSLRKGIEALLQACAQAAQPLFVIIAGQQDAQARALLAAFMPQLRTRVLQIDGFISPELETQLFCACDAVWLGYEGHYGMSGVLVQAYRFGKPIIASPEGLIGWFARRERLGPVLADRSAAAVLAAIDEALRGTHGATAQIPLAHAGTQGRDGHSVLAHHTVADFKQVILQTLAGALQRQVDPGSSDGMRSNRAPR